MNSSNTAKQKRHRRTGADIKELFSGVVAICDEYDEPISIRHLFYRCSNAGLIEKTEQAYNSLRSHLVKWREQRLIPFNWFIDGTRYHYGHNTFNDLGEYLRHCSQSYRLNLWKDSDYYVEVWTEKDAIAAAVNKIAEEWNLRTFVCRGDPSMSSLDAAARTFNHHAPHEYRPVILYLGDYDETGLAIPKTIEGKLLSNHDCAVELIRVGINEEHILRFNLPTRPAKGDRRGESIDYAVDIDAMKPADLREILAKEIESFIDPDQLERMRLIEGSERETLETIDIDNLLRQ
ncbi:MAG: hypothetical protein NTW21_16540 [Verrucomicrobia bacterium]|nr:hypothetical protein [Verrucomicrobiota bacterium]